MSKHCYIRAEVVGLLPSGQKLVHLLASNADGIRFYTDDRSLVSADNVEQRRGEWVRGFYNPEKRLYVYRCSECRQGCYHGFQKVPIWGYCPNCGARMEG